MILSGYDLIERAKKGRSVSGEFGRVRSGKHAGALIYVTGRNRNDSIWKDGANGVGQALREGIARWRIPVDTLSKARAMGVRYIVIRSDSMGHIYACRLEDFFCPDKSQRAGPSEDRQRGIKLGDFSKKQILTFKLRR